MKENAEKMKTKCIYCGSTEDVERTWRSLDVAGHGDVVDAVPLCRSCRLKLESNECQRMETIEEQLKLTLEQYELSRLKKKEWLYKNFTGLIRKISGMSGSLQECGHRLDADYLEHLGMWEMTYSLINECYQNFESVLNDMLNYKAFVEEMNEVQEKRWSADREAKEKKLTEEAIKAVNALVGAGIDMGNEFELKGRRLKLIGDQWVRDERDTDIPF
jgi:hypothetical protein